MDNQNPLDTLLKCLITFDWQPHYHIHPGVTNLLIRLLQDNVVFASTEHNARTGDGDKLGADPLEHPTNLNETRALNSCPAYDRDYSKSITTTEGTTRDHGAATRRLTTFSLTTNRSTTRKRPVIGVDKSSGYPEDFVSPTLEGSNASSVPACKHLLGKGRACNYEDRNEDSYARERQSKSDDRLGVRPKEINSDEKRAEECGSYQATNQSAAESACYSSVHENLRKRDALGERLANAFRSRRQRATCLR